MPSFGLPPHVEKSITRQNQDRERFAAFAATWIDDDRAISIATRAGIVGANAPEHAGPMVGSADIPLTDDQANDALARGIAYVNETFNLVGSAAEQNQQGPQIDPNDPTQNENFDFRNPLPGVGQGPGQLATEAMQWFQRSPGRLLSEKTPLGTTPVRGATRAFMLVADAAVDTVSDRIWRAGVEAFSQGENPGEWITEYADEMLGDLYDPVGGTEDVIGNKPLWGVFGELSEGNRVNIGTGYIPNSEMAPGLQESLERGQQDVAQYSADVHDQYQQDPDNWVNVQKYGGATPYSEALKFEGTRTKQAWREGQNAPGQAELGRPITQGYETKAESYIKPIGERISPEAYKGMQQGGFGLLNPSMPVTEGPNAGLKHYDRVSGGRIIAAYTTEPGTAESHWVSGIGDTAKQLGLDPLIALGKPGKLIKGARRVGMTDAGVAAARSLNVTPDVVKAVREAPSAFSKDAVLALKKSVGGDYTPQELGQLVSDIRAATTDDVGIVLANRARQTVDPKKANLFLTGGQAQPVVAALVKTTKMDEVSAILSGVKGRVPSSLRKQLVEATTETQVIDALLPYMDSGFRFQGNLSTWGELSAAGSMSEFFLGQGILRAPTQAARLAVSSPYHVVDKLSQSGLDSLSRLKTGLPSSTAPSSVVGDLTMRARTRYAYGNSWAGRMVNDASNAGIRADDMDKAYVDVEKLARNGGISTSDIIVQTDKGRVLKGKTMDNIKAQLDAGEKINPNKIHDVDQYMRDLAALGNHDEGGLANVMFNILDAVGMDMRGKGIDEVFIRQATRLYEEGTEASKYFVGQVGDSVNYPGTGFSALLDGEMAMMPAGKLLNEFHKGVVNVPDPRILRRALAEGNAAGRMMNRVMTQKARRIPKLPDLSGDWRNVYPGNWDVTSQSLADRAAVRYARLFMNNVWKPAKLLKLGYPVKIILGDEQARMIAMGLSSIWTPWRGMQGDSPLSYLAMVLSDRPLIKKFLDNRNIDIFGDELSLSRQWKDSVSLKGNSFGEVGALRSDSWTLAKQGTDDYTDALTTEVAQLLDDPLTTRLFDEVAGTGDNVADTKAWLLSDDPDAVVLLGQLENAIRRTNPMVAENFKAGGPAMDNYLASVNARAHLKSGGDYIVVDPNTGNVLNSSDDIIGKVGEGEYAKLGPGFHITRTGDPELLKAMNSGMLGDTSVTGLNRKGYNALKNDMKKRIDDNPELYPEAVKSGHHRVGTNTDQPKMAKQILNTLMDWVVAKPAENLSRSPTFTQLYWRQMGAYLPDMTDEAAESLLARAAKIDMKGTVQEAGRLSGKGRKGLKNLGLDDLEELDMYSKAFAAEGVIDLLFDFAKRKNSLDALNLIFPFGDAFLEAFTSYGRIFANNPALVRRPLKGYEELQGGNPLEWGEEEQTNDEGFFHTNDFGEEVFSIPFQFGGPQQIGMEFDIPIGNMNMIAAQFYPPVGWVVTIPASAVIPDNPAFEGFKDWIAPFGMPDDPISGIVEETFGAHPTVNRVLAAFTQGKFLGPQQERIYNQTKGWVIKEMLGTGEYTAEDLSNPDVNAEMLRVADERTQWMYLTRAALQLSLPAAPTAPKLFPTIDDDDPARFEKMALQDAASAVYQIYEEVGDWETAQKMFHERHGYDSVPLLVSSYKENAKRGTTFDAWETENRFPEVYEQLPQTAYYLTPDDPEDPFFYKAWDEQFKSGTRELKTTEDWTDDYIYRIAASDYRRSVEEVTAAVEDGSLEVPENYENDEFIDLVADQIKTELIERFPSYAAEVDIYDESEMQGKISELREWSLYDRLDNNPTANAIDEFFTESWDPAKIALLDTGHGRKEANVLPFTGSGANAVLKDGSLSESWAVRSEINALLLEEGERLATTPGNGHFALVWEDIIKPTIHDYRGSLIRKNPPPPTSHEDLVASLLGE